MGSPLNSTVEYPQLRDDTSSSEESSHHDDLFRTWYEQLMETGEDMLMPGWDEDYQYPE